MHKSNRWTDKSRNSILSLFCTVIMEAFHFLNSTFCLSHFPEEISHECFLVNIYILKPVQVVDLCLNVRGIKCIRLSDKIAFIRCIQWCKSNQCRLIILSGYSVCYLCGIVTCQHNFIIWPTTTTALQIQFRILTFYFSWISHVQPQSTSSPCPAITLVCEYFFKIHI